MSDELIQNTELFTGKAEAYAKARPGYCDAAMDYIFSLVPGDVALAEIGAGTGKFTLSLTRRGHAIFAVEPNADMRRQLTAAAAAYPSVSIIDGTAEATSLPDNSVDAVLCAQALHWFDPEAFRAECKRICRPDGIVIAVYNSTPGGESAAHGKTSTAAFFRNPAVREFPNPIYYTRENWLTFMSSHSHSPLPSDPSYAAHLETMNAVFDRENEDGLLRRDVTTVVYSEKIVYLQ